MTSSTTTAETAPLIGARADRTKVVTLDDITLFTAISGDRNALHYDTEPAARSRFAGIVVQGGVTSSLVNAVVAEQLPGPGSVFLETRWRYRAPVRPGDVITASVEVLSTRSDRPVTTLSTVIDNQDGVAVLDGTAVVWRDPETRRSALPAIPRRGGEHVRADPHRRRARPGGSVRRARLRRFPSHGAAL